jgi:hypothetical protein
VSRIALRDRALVIAQSQIGVREQGPPNHGPEVEGYLWAVGLGPGYPWCLAFVVWAYVTAARELGLDMPLRLTGKVARLWRGSPGLWRSNVPSIGSIFIHLTDPDDADSTGHCGIVTSVNSYKSFNAVEGNTNRAGSRVGGQVLENTRSRNYAVGFIDIGAEGPMVESRVS